MIAIWRRELLSCYHTIIGWLFTAVLWLFTAVYISFNCLLGLNSSIVSGITVSVMVLLVLVPVLTMGFYTLERRNKTDQMILTAPVTIPGIVLGKFLAAATVFTAPVAAICGYPLLLSHFGHVNMAESYLAIGGFWLYGLAEIAVCLFISSLMTSPVAAAVLSFAVLFATFVMKALTTMLQGPAQYLAEALDMPSRFDQFINGTLDIGAAVYLLTVTMLFLFLTMSGISSRRSALAGSGAKRSVMRLGAVLAAVAVTAGVNAGVGRLPEQKRIRDFTESGIFSLTEDTKKYISGLNEDVTIYVWSDEAGEDKSLARTLELYRQLSDHIKIEHVDPSANPSFIQQYADPSSVYKNSLIVTGSRRAKVVSYGDIYRTEMNYTSGGYEVTGYDAEGRITSAISYVLTDDAPKVYMLTGHGETALPADFTAAVEKVNADTGELNLLTAASVPEDADAVVINAPASDLSPEDLGKLKQYISAGGSLILTVPYEIAEKMPNYAQLLGEYGVTVDKGIVVEKDSHYYLSTGAAGGVPTYLLPIVSEDTTITAQVLGGNGYVFLPLGQALRHGETDDSHSYTDILTTSEQAFLHGNTADLPADGSPKEEENDPRGPFAVGLRAVRKYGEQSSTAVILSSPSIFTDEADSIVSGSNQKLLSGAVVSVAKMPDTVTVPIKSYGGEKLTVPAGQALLLSAVSIAVIPLFLLAAGIIVLIRRRRR